MASLSSILPLAARARHRPLALWAGSGLIGALLLLPLAFLLLEARQVGWGQLSALLFRQLTLQLLWNMVALTA
ncbi:MAG: hypothetical protein ACRENV_04045, partial [Candidatus Dormibacteria bacterium]